MKRLLRGSTFVIVALSIYLTCAEGSYIPISISDAPSGTNLSDSEPSGFYNGSLMQTIGMIDGNIKDANEDPGNSTKTNVEDKLNEILNPFLAFPFFPFHFPNLKRDVFHLNSTEKTIQIEKEGKLSDTRRKPFLFFDFAFNVREVPQKNQTEGSRSAAQSRTSAKASEKSDAKKDVPFDIIDDDWSFFDDSPLLSPDMDEFLPKSDFLFFDFPFHRKQSKKFVRNKRDMTRPVFKSDLDLFVDLLDESLSRTEKDSERLEPLWVEKSDELKSVRRENKGEIFDDKSIIGADAKPKDKRSMRGIKRRSSELMRHKNPVILGKVLKFGEIHFGDDYPKTKKKRRSASGTNKKGNNRFQETSIEMVQMNEPFREDNFPKYLDMSPLHASLKDVFRRIHSDHQESIHEREHKEIHSKLSPKSEDVKILDLMNQWDRREMEQMATATTQKSGTAQSNTYSYKGQESGRSHSKLMDEGFKHIGHKPAGRYQIRDSVGFEEVKPQTSFARHKRQESGSGIEENVTPSKDEVRRNITQVLGEFFSMIRKLGDSKSFYHDKDNPDVEDMNWPELDDAHGSGAYVKMQKLRRARDAENGEEEKPHPVADLKYLFLTVTLPTMFAFTLLLVVCFFNLRVRGWLCTKLFKPRHVYVVEADVEKAGKTTKVMKNEVLDDKNPQQEGNLPEEEKHKPQERAEKAGES